MKQDSNVNYLDLEADEGSDDLTLLFSPSNSNSNALESYDNWEAEPVVAFSTQ